METKCENYQMQKIPLKIKVTIETPQEMDDAEQSNIFLPDGKSWIDIRPKIPQRIQMDTETFERIWNMHPQEQRKGKMFGKEISYPRWEQTYGHDYKYAGHNHLALPVADQYLKLVLEWVRTDSGLSYQGLLINWYEDGNHYIGWHADNESIIVPNSPIYSFSFGQERIFAIKSKSGQYNKEILMRNGSLIIMGGEMQKYYKHSVPKISKNQCPGKRINLTFRLFHK